MINKDKKRENQYIRKIRVDQKEKFSLKNFDNFVHFKFFSAAWADFRIQLAQALRAERMPTV